MVEYVFSFLAGSAILSALLMFTVRALIFIKIDKI